MMGFAGPKELLKLLDAVQAVGSDLDLPVVLRRIVESATDLVGARYGALGVLDARRRMLTEFVTVGVDEDTQNQIGDLPSGHGILGVLIDDPRPLRLPDLSAHPDSQGFPPNHPPMSSFLGVPILIRGVAYGNLYLCDKIGDEAFSDIDQALVVSLASAAGVAIDHARLVSRVAELALADDRDRIARDLHDTAIQRLFAIGLGLQSVVRIVDQPKVAERIEQAVDEIDDTVREIRSAIFKLHSVKSGGRSVRQAAIELCAESARALGFEPATHFEGPIDTALDADLAVHLLAVEREALSNVVKHARASAVDLTITARDGRVSLVLEDDGVGVDPTRASGGRGIVNMRARARELGGDCSIEPRTNGGSVLVWSIPTPAGRPSRTAPRE